MTPALLLHLAACAPSIAGLRLYEEPAPPDDSAPVTPDAPVDDPDATDETDAEEPALVTWSVSVDATDAAAWVHLDVPGRAIVSAEDAWTVRVQRYRVALNGGVSGSGGAEAAWVLGGDTDPLDLPAGPWVTDLADNNDDGEPEYALGAWYRYDGTTHVLTAEDRRYWVRSADHEPVSVVFHDYYDEAGTSGHVAMTWTLLGAADSGGAR